MRGAAIVVALLVVAYFAGYALLRTTQAEVWAQDGRNYVIFPEDAKPLYYFYRPLSYADQALTGTGAHIGPHRDGAEARS